MLNIIICDDNTAMLDLFAAVLKKYADLYNQEVEIVTFCNGHDALTHSQTNKFDIVYMDLELGEANGMDYAKKMKEINPNALVIYISAYNYYYEPMVQAEPFRFILKDVDIARMEKNILSTFEAAIERIHGGVYFSYVFDGMQYQIELDDIRYFYSDRRKIHIVGNIGEASNYFYGKMDELEIELENLSCRFVRINRSHIVNSKCAYLILNQKNKVEVDGTVFSVTSKYRNKVIERITSIKIK